VPLYPCSVSATNIGLWLVGVGSLLVVVGAIILPPDAGIGARFKTRQTALQQRIIFAVQTTGLAFIAGGSVTVAAAQSIAWWLIGVTVLTVVVSCDVLLAWPLKRAWDERSEVATAVASTGGEIANTAAAQRQATVARRCATWRWCLSHPLNHEKWPGIDSGD
jgi:hypothetical protein